MIGNLLVLAILVVLIGALVLLARRAVRARRPALRWAGVIVTVLPALLLLLVVAVSGIGLYRLAAPRDFPVASLTVARTPAQVARGERLATALCAACHGREGALPLAGGPNLSADAGLPLGDLYPPNLTPAGEIAGWSDGEVLRAIREGTHQRGRPLVVMPSQNLRHLSDEDAQAIIAYLRSQPAVPSRVPPTSPSLLAALMVGAGMIDVSAQPVPAPVVAPPRAATSEYGRYLVSISDCRDCHGANLDGQAAFPAPPGPNLRSAAGWTPEQFVQAMRTGTTPAGRALQPPMPWRQIGALDDGELRALHAYLRSLPPT
jgi:mono/diheme cytochrome c family protein